MEAGRANAALPDNEVLAFAAAENRILISHNRLHFLRLRQHRAEAHAGIMLCTFDPDFAGLAQRIHTVITGASETNDQLWRINRPGSISS
jgi:hypothetical protein